MAAKSYLRMLAGRLQQVAATVISRGSANGGDLVALGDDGKLHSSVLPSGVGANTQVIPASELIGAGKFVNYWKDSSSGSAVLKIRLADNSNGRRADGFVLDQVASGANGTVYPLDQVNSALSALDAGTDYFLGTAGGVTATPLDETSTDNQGKGKITQFLGVAKSTTELITSDSQAVTL